MIVWLGKQDVTKFHVHLGMDMETQQEVVPWSAGIPGGQEKS